MILKHKKKQCVQRISVNPLEEFVFVVVILLKLFLCTTLQLLDRVLVVMLPQLDVRSWD
jgi:hypothetical protein